jgi:lactoylglutathione lyase
MPKARKARAVGFNHVALEVGDIEEALSFYGRLFEFELRGKSEGMAFIDLGDQFLALQKGRTQPSDDGRHFGLVVDDKDAVRQALAEAGVEALPGPFLDFRDPWGNRVEIVGYDNIQFSKTPGVLRGMGLTHLAKKAEAIHELAEKGMAPDGDPAPERADRPSPRSRPPRGRRRAAASRGAWRRARAK